MSRYHRPLAALAVLSSILIAGSAAQAQDVIKVGAPLPLTGPLSPEARWSSLIATPTPPSPTKVQGATWAQIDAGLPVPQTGQQIIRAVAISPAFATDHTLLVATQDGGLSISRDRGNTWSVVDQ